MSSHKYFGMKNKQQKHPKVDFHQYLYNSNEPQIDKFSHRLNNVEIDLLEDRLYMKQHIRNKAKILRVR